MAEILAVIGGAGSVISLLESCGRVWKFLDDFARNSLEVELVAHDLQSKVEQLRVCCETVQRTGRSWKSRLPNDGQPDPDEVAIWSTIDKTMKQCGHVITKFQNALEGLSSGKQNAWLRGALMQRRYEKREPRIRRLEKKIDLHLSTLNILILSAHLYKTFESILEYQANNSHSIANGNHQDELKSMFARGMAIIDRLDASMRNGRNEIDDTRTTEILPPNYETDSAIDLDEEDERVDGISNLKMALDTGDSIKARAIYEGDGDSVFSGRSGQSVPFSNHLSQFNFGVVSTRPGAEISLSTSAPSSRPYRIPNNHLDLPDQDEDEALVDSTPYFDDTTPREVLESLIDKFKSQAISEFKAGHFHQAEENQLEAILRLEELYVGYGVPFDDFSEMRIFLGEIYYEQNRLEDARRLMNDVHATPGSNITKSPTIVGAGVAPSNARRFHLLAKTHRRMYAQEESDKRYIYLNMAERDAKRAFICGFRTRETNDEAFIEAVKLLIQIYEDRGKWVHVATYRDLYLPKTIQRPAAPKPSPQRPASQNQLARESSPLLPLVRVPSSQNTITSDRTIYSDSTSAGRQSTDNDLEVVIADGREDLIEDILLTVSKSAQEKAVVYAVDKSNERAIERLSRAGVGLEEALFHAIRNGRADMTHLLINLDANKEARDPKSNATPFLDATKSPSVAVLRELLNNNVNTRAKNNQGWSAVHSATHTGNKEMLRLLLEPQYRVNVDAVDNVGKTALHYMAERNDVEMGKILLKHQANPNLMDKTAIGRTPLYIAVTQTKLEFAKMLLEHGVTFPYDREEVIIRSRDMNNLLDNWEQQRAKASAGRRHSSISSKSKNISFKGFSSLVKRKSHSDTSTSDPSEQAENEMKVTESPKRSSRFALSADPYPK